MNDIDLFIDTLRIPDPLVGRPDIFVSDCLCLVPMKCRRLVIDNYLSVRPPKAVAKLVINFRETFLSTWILQVYFNLFYRLQVQHVVFIARTISNPSVPGALMADHTEARGEADATTFC